jgi:hypothetical protein
LDRYKYYLYTGLTKASWHDAQAACVAKGGFLATLDTAEKMNFVNNLIGHGAGSAWDDTVWIGCRQTGDFHPGYDSTGTRGVFEFVHGGGSCTKKDAVYTAWSGKGPNNANGGENCVHLWNDGKGWNDGNCETSINYICERTPHSCTEAPFTFTTEATFTSQQQMEMEGWTFSDGWSAANHPMFGNCPGCSSNSLSNCAGVVLATVFCGWMHSSSPGTITKELAGSGKLTLVLKNGGVSGSSVWVKFKGANKARLGSKDQETIFISFGNGDELLIAEDHGVMHIISLTYEYACDHDAPTTTTPTATTTTITSTTTTSRTATSRTATTRTITSTIATNITSTSTIATTTSATNTTTSATTILGTNAKGFKSKFLPPSFPTTNGTDSAAPNATQRLNATVHTAPTSDASISDLTSSVSQTVGIAIGGLLLLLLIVSGLLHSRKKKRDHTEAAKVRLCWCSHPLNVRITRIHLSGLYPGVLIPLPTYMPSHRPTTNVQQLHTTM